MPTLTRAARRHHQLPPALVRVIDVTLLASSLSCTEAVEKIARFDDEGYFVKKDGMTEREFDLLCVSIAKLPPQRRKVLMLRVFYEYSTRQIAESLNMPLRRVHLDLAGALEAVHAARAMFEVDRRSAFTNLIAKQRHGIRDT